MCSQSVGSIRVTRPQPGAVGFWGLQLFGSRCHLLTEILCSSGTEANKEKKYEQGQQGYGQHGSGYDGRSGTGTGSGSGTGGGIASYIPGKSM